MSNIFRLRRGTQEQIDSASLSISEVVHNTDTDELVLGGNGGVKKVFQSGEVSKVSGTMYKANTAGSSVNIPLGTETFAYTTGNKIEFEADADATQPLTLSVGTGSNLPLVDTDGVGLSLEAGKIYIGFIDEFEGTSVFTVAVRGGDGSITPPVIIGGVSFSEKYDGINIGVKDTEGSSISVSVGDYVYSEPNSVEITGNTSGGSVDKSTPQSVTTLNSLDAMELNASQKFVTNDDKLFYALKDGTSIKFYQTDFDFTNTVLLGTYSLGTNGIFDFAIEVDVNRIHCVIAVSASPNEIDFLGFDITEADGTDITTFSSTIENVIDTDTTYLVNKVDIKKDSGGNIHVVWDAKTTTYSLSHNIKHCKSIDYGLNWATPTFVTSMDGSTQGTTKPSLIIASDNNPLVVFQFQAGAQYYYCYYSKFNGTTWSTYSPVFPVASSYVIYFSANINDSGKICVAVEQTEGFYRAIDIATSVDDGTNWDTSATISEGGVDPTYNNLSPVVSFDSLGEFYVIWERNQTGTLDLNMCSTISGVWQSVVNITNDGTKEFQSPQILKGFSNFTIPPVLTTDVTGGNLYIVGAWTTEVTEKQTFPVSSDALTGDDLKCTLAGVLKFSNPTLNDRVTGFVSDTNLID